MLLDEAGLEQPDFVVDQLFKFFGNSATTK
jgi:hypothetical protein